MSTECDEDKNFAVNDHVLLDMTDVVTASNIKFVRLEQTFQPELEMIQLLSVLISSHINGITSLDSIFS